VKTRAAALILLVAAGVASGATLAQGGSAPGQWATAAWSKSPPARADVNQGRFVALGGEFGELRFACLSCHGFEGQADPSGAFPRLADQSAWYMYNSLRDFASGLRPSKVMGPIAAELSDDQMLDVAAYYASLEGVPYPPELRHDEQLMKQGEQIATFGLAPEAGVPACSTCHGDQGIGHAPVYPFLAGQYRPYLEHQLKLFKAGRRGGDPLNVMHAIAARLSDQQIEAVAAYFASLRPERTTPAEAARRTARIVPPEPLPMMTGAVLSPRPGDDDVVLPDASVPAPAATPEQAR
jgi:cytochrome c553